MATAVGLDIHERGIRAVEVTGRGKNFRVLKYLERAVTPRGGQPDPEEARTALNEVFRAGHLSKNGVVCAVEAGETVVREIPVPFRSDDQIRKVVKFEAEHHLHDCDADDVIVQYAKVSETKEGSNLLVFAARKDEIGRRIEYARAAGVEPLAMDLDAVAIFTAVRAAGLIEDSPECVLLNIGHRSTDMIFVEGGNLRALRSVRLGVDTMAQGLARDMDIDVSEAGSRMQALAAAGEGDLLVPLEAGDPGRKETDKSHAELERDLFANQRKDFVARMKREFVRSTASLGAQAAPKRVLVTGPGLRVAGLLEMLGERLGLPVEPFHPSQHFACKLSGESAADFDSAGTVALGLALKGLGADALRIDFRQEEMKVANKMELLKGTLAVTVTLLFLALIGGAFHFITKKNSLADKRYRVAEEEAYNVFEATAKLYNRVNPFGDKGQVDAAAVANQSPNSEAIQRYARTLTSMRSKLRQHFGGGDAPPITSALQVWNDVFKVLQAHHKDIAYFDVERIEIEQDNAIIALVLPSIVQAERIKQPLGNIDALKKMELQSLGQSPVAGTDFVRVVFEFKEKRER